MSKFIDLTGQKFGRLTVIKRAASRGYNTYWMCKCTCRIIKDVQGNNLKDGQTQSCGCYKKECHATHGLAKSSTYIAYYHMIGRCYNIKHESYKNYGNRGITVCARWLESFENFVEDMGEKPSPELSIERINNDGDYEPSNCIWTTLHKQSHNKRKRKNATSQYIGVHKHKDSGKWTTQITWKRQTHHLGLFKSEPEAHRAYERAKRRLFRFKKRNTPIKKT